MAVLGNTRLFPAPIPLPQAKGSQSFSEGDQTLKSRQIAEGADGSGAVFRREAEKRVSGMTGKSGGDWWGGPKSGR